MKLKLFLLFFAFVLAAPVAQASFPVKRAAVTTTVEADNTTEDVLYSPAAAVAGDDQLIALLLWFFLGGLAGHRWYLGSPVGWNILFILTLGGLGIWWIIDGIDIITGNYPGL